MVLKDNFRFSFGRFHLWNVISTERRVTQRPMRNAKCVSHEHANTFKNRCFAVRHSIDETIIISKTQTQLDIIEKLTLIDLPATAIAHGPPHDRFPPAFSVESPARE